MQVNKQIVEVPFLAGIGFTMANFIASLAFENSPIYIDSAKTGIIMGSLISAITGFMILRWGEYPIKNGIQQAGI